MKKFLREEIENRIQTGPQLSLSKVSVFPFIFSHILSIPQFSWLGRRLHRSAGQPVRGRRAVGEVRTVVDRTAGDRTVVDNAR